MILQIYKYFYGIDPGHSGALARVTPEGKFVSVEDLPTTDKDWLNILDVPHTLFDCFCTLEDVHALPNQSTVAGFTFGKNVGKAELLALRLCSDKDPLRVPPQRWKKYFKLDKDKHKSVELARELFPEAVELLKVSKDGRAEALLIAEYGRRSLLGEL